MTHRKLFGTFASLAAASLLCNVATDGTEGAASAAAPAPLPLGKSTTANFSFHFRTDKTRDDEGKVIGNGRKHPSFDAVLPIPTYNNLIEHLQNGGKEAELILDGIQQLIYAAARDQIDSWREANGMDKDFAPSLFDLGKLSLTAIANTPKSERAGAAISDEDWTAFLADYTHVMTQVVGYDANKVKLHVTHLKVKLARVKNDKDSVRKLLEFLNVWAAKTEAMDDHAACYEDLAKRAGKYLKAEPIALASAL